MMVDIAHFVKSTSHTAFGVSFQVLTPLDTKLDKRHVCADSEFAFMHILGYIMITTCEVIAC